MHCRRSCRFLVLLLAAMLAPEPAIVLAQSAAIESRIAQLQQQYEAAQQRFVASGSGTFQLDRDRLFQLRTRADEARFRWERLRDERIALEDERRQLDQTRDLDPQERSQRSGDIADRMLRVRNEEGSAETAHRSLALEVEQFERDLARRESEHAQAERDIERLRGEIRQAEAQLSDARRQEQEERARAQQQAEQQAAQRLLDEQAEQQARQNAASRDGQPAAQPPAAPAGSAQAPVQPAAQSAPPQRAQPAAQPAVRVSWPAGPEAEAARAAGIKQALAHLDAALQRAPQDAPLQELRALFAAAETSTARPTRLDMRAVDQVIAQARGGGEESLRAVLTQTDAAVRLSPHVQELWAARLDAALALEEEEQGWRAARALLALGADNSESDFVLDALATAQRRGWLTDDSAWLSARAAERAAEEARQAELALQQQQAEAAQAARMAQLRLWEGPWVGTHGDTRVTLDVVVQPDGTVVPKVEEVLASQVAGGGHVSGTQHVTRIPGEISGSGASTFYGNTREYRSSSTTTGTTRVLSTQLTLDGRVLVLRYAFDMTRRGSDGSIAPSAGEQTRVYVLSDDGASITECVRPQNDAGSPTAAQVAEWTLLGGRTLAHASRQPNQVSVPGQGMFAPALDTSKTWLALMLRKSDQFSNSGEFSDAAQALKHAGMNDDAVRTFRRQGNAYAGFGLEHIGAFGIVEPLDPLADGDYVMATAMSRGDEATIRKAIRDSKAGAERANWMVAMLPRLQQDEAFAKMLADTWRELDREREEGGFASTTKKLVVILGGLGRRAELEDAITRIDTRLARRPGQYAWLLQQARMHAFFYLDRPEEALAAFDAITPTIRPSLTAAVLRHLHRLGMGDTLLERYAAQPYTIASMHSAQVVGAFLASQGRLDELKRRFDAATPQEATMLACGAARWFMAQNR